MVLRACARLCLAAAALALGACASYNARWKAAAAAPRADAFSGAWKGTWTSGKYGAGGPLWCILVPTGEQGSGEYQAFFKAGWHKIFTSTHDVVLKTATGKSSKAAEPKKFSGSAKLKSIIGSGTYHCEGSISPSAIKASYDASYDVGTFELSRP